MQMFLHSPYLTSPKKRKGIRVSYYLAAARTMWGLEGLSPHKNNSVGVDPPPLKNLSYKKSFFMYAYTHMYMYIHTHTHTYIYIPMYTYMYIHTYIYNENCHSGPPPQKFFKVGASVTLCYFPFPLLFIFVS